MWRPGPEELLYEVEEQQRFLSVTRPGGDLLSGRFSRQTSVSLMDLVLALVLPDLVPENLAVQECTDICRGLFLPKTATREVAKRWQDLADETLQAATRNVWCRMASASTALHERYEGH